jgi:hypothetical protein
MILAPLGFAAVILLSGCQDESKGAKGQITRKTPVIDSNKPSNATAVQQASVEGPRITFEKTSYDFGDIVPEKKYKHQFTFKNTGTTSLKIVNVQPCCGTVVTGVEAGQVYAPGKSGALEFEFTSGQQPGSIARTIYITTNDPVLKTVGLEYKAEITRQVAYEPTTLRLFLRRENGGAGDLTITSSTGQPFSVTGFRSTADCITAKFDPSVKDTRFVLKLSADMEKLKQHKLGRVEVLLTHPGCKTLSLDYDVLPEFTFNPSQLIAFNLKPGVPAQKELWIQANYDDDFELESVTSKNGMLKVVDKEKVKLAPGLTVGQAPGAADQKEARYQYKLKLEIVPPNERAPLSDMLQVTIKGGGMWPIEYRGFYEPGN